MFDSLIWGYSLQFPESSWTTLLLLFFGRNLPILHRYCCIETSIFYKERLQVTFRVFFSLNSSFFLNFSCFFSSSLRIFFSFLDGSVASGEDSGFLLSALNIPSEFCSIKLTFFCTLGLTGGSKTNSLVRSSCELLGVGLLIRSLPRLGGRWSPELEVEVETEDLE